MIDWERVVAGELRASSYCVRKVRFRRRAGEASFVAEISWGYTTRRHLWLSVRGLAWLLREGEGRNVDKGNGVDRVLSLPVGIFSSRRTLTLSIAAPRLCVGFR